MQVIAVLLLLLSPLLAHAQITVGDAIPQTDVDQAKATLAKASAKTVALQTGEFEIIEPAKTVTGPLLWIISNEDILQRIDVAAQQSLALWMKRRGEDTAKLHLLGVRPGSSTILIVRNGATPETAPMVVDKLVVSVGGPAPMPPTPPVEDEFTKSLRTALQRDQQANKADRRWLQALAGIYEAASRDPLDTIKTAGDLDQLLNVARQAAGIPEPDQMLTNVRQRIRQELLTQLNVPENGQAQPLTAETKRLAKQVLARIAQALEALSS